MKTLLNVCNVKYIVILFVFLYSSCKKYDENKILFSPPEKVMMKLSGAHIVYCKIDGHDSTGNMIALLPNYTKYEFKYVPNSGISVESSYYFNCVFGFESEPSDEKYYLLTFSKDRKEFEIYPKWNKTSNRFIPSVPKRELFFHIKKLTTKELKITTNINNKEYELYLSK